MAGGLWLAGLLQDQYAATREAFAAGAVRVEQVRVIVQAAEQAPAEATPVQVAAGRGVAGGQGHRCRDPVGTADGRQAAAAGRAPDVRRLDPDLAVRHEAILLGRETRTAEAETFLVLHDNGDGSYTGRFRIPELHGHLLTDALDRLTAPRRLARDQAGQPVVDLAAPGGDWGAELLRDSQGAALCELIEHLPTRGSQATVAR